MFHGKFHTYYSSQHYRSIGHLLGSEKNKTVGGAFRALWLWQRNGKIQKSYEFWGGFGRDGC